jgi:hypothetical protein
LGLSAQAGVRGAPLERVNAALSFGVGWSTLVAAELIA